MDRGGSSSSTNRFVPASRRAVLASTMTMAAASPSLAQTERSRTLRFVPQASLTLLDPVFSLTSVTAVHGNHVFDTLYGVDAQLRPQPQMAEGHVVSDDGLTCDITLREGLRFHDGEPVRAVDCIASLRRWAQRDVFGRDVAAAVEAWEAPEDRRIRIRLKRPFPLLIYALGKPNSHLAVIMPERLANTDPGRQVTEMVGSGPYRFLADEFVAGSRVAYRKFEAYVPRPEAPSWLAGGKVAHFDRIEWHVMPDAATAAAALQAGEVDWWEQAQPDLTPLLRRNRNIAIERIDPVGYIPVMRFNSRNAPFDNPAIRRALLSAVDQEPYLTAVTGNDPDAWRRCHSFFPCGTPFGEAQQPDPMARPDIDAARRALREAGYDGQKVVLLNPADFPTIAPLGHITHDLLKRLGMNVELVDTDWGTVVTRNQSREPVERGGWSLYHTWWGGVSLVLPATNTTIRGAGLRGWTGWYESERMEQLNATWLTSGTDADRARIAAEMQALAFEDVPSVPLGQFFINTAYRRSITGVLQGPRAAPWNVRRA